MLHKNLFVAEFWMMVVMVIVSDLAVGRRDVGEHVSSVTQCED